MSKIDNSKPHAIHFVSKNERTSESFGLTTPTKPEFIQPYSSALWHSDAVSVDCSGVLDEQPTTEEVGQPTVQELVGPPAVVEAIAQTAHPSLQPNHRPADVVDAEGQTAQRSRRQRSSQLPVVDEEVLFAAPSLVVHASSSDRRDFISSNIVVI